MKDNNNCVFVKKGKNIWIIFFKCVFFYSDK